MTTTFLFAANRPADTDTAAIEKWWPTTQILSRAAKQIAGVEEIASGCWLFRAKDGVSFLGHAIQTCKQQGVAYKVLILPDYPEFAA